MSQPRATPFKRSWRWHNLREILTRIITLQVLRRSWIDRLIFERIARRAFPYRVMLRAGSQIRRGENFPPEDSGDLKSGQAKSPRNDESGTLNKPLNTRAAPPNAGLSLPKVETSISSSSTVGNLLSWSLLRTFLSTNE